MNPEPKRLPAEERPVEETVGRLFYFAARMRLGGALLLWLVALLYACFDPVPWKVALPAITGVFMAAVMVMDLRRIPDRVLAPRHVARVMGTVLVGFCVFIVLTGGIRSPFLLMSPVMSLATVVGTGHPRWFLPPLLLLMSTGWVLALGDLLGPLAVLVPGVFRAGAPAPAPAALSLALLFFFTAGLVVPALIGLRFRRALERAIAETTRARDEHVAALQAHNAELMDLSRTVAHELKNPLASIQGLAGLLARRQEPGSREAERAGVLVDETRRLAALLDEFLNFGRPVQGLAVRPVEPGELVAAVARLFEARLRPLAVRLDTELRTVRPLRGDPRKLQQVLVNLVDNAIQASPRGGCVLLRVEDGEDGGHAITVLDEGPGLPEAVRARLFQPGTTTRAGGSGLGLAIARQIVRQHGGELHVEDRPQGGCVARIELPRRPAPAGDGTGVET